MRYLGIVLFAAALLLLGCGSPLASPQADRVHPHSSPSTSPASSSAATCHASGSGSTALPDPSCTPGTTNPAVTQQNVGSTICRSGWSTQQREQQFPKSASERVKDEVMASYGLPRSDASQVEADHLVAIEIGGQVGGPGIERNIWPEPNDHPKAGVLNTKDEVEDAAHAAVCSGRMPLTTAQQEMASNWVQLGQQLGVS